MSESESARARTHTHTHTHTQDEGDSVTAIESLQRKPPQFEDEKTNTHTRALLARTSMNTESSEHGVFGMGMDGARSAVAVRSTVANRSTISELLPTAKPFFAAMPGVRAVQLRQIRRQNTQNNSRATMLH